MFFDILTLFPAMFDGVFSESILSRAVERGLIDVTTWDIRDYSSNKHRKVDDYPYGGAPGMLMKPEPLAAALQDAKERHKNASPRTVFLTPRGRLLNHRVVTELSREDGLILLCGHYKGIDERITRTYIDDEISIGDYVLSGGELGAMAVVDAVSRLIPEVLGNESSAECDSHYNGLLSAPAYTRPEVFEGQAVPPVLLSGHHKKICEWQRQQAEEKTKNVRPDLWAEYEQDNEK
ncbi:MAG: tRNA (guanosine(37)-N1)-methyltransferase TrmD [Fibrobacterota bacterium]